MILKELKMERKSLIIWTIALLFFMLASMQKYTAFTGTGAEEMMQIFDKMPEVLKAMFGMSALDITSIVGYYGALYFYLILIVSVHALLLGIKLVTREESLKANEFLYTKPISRKKILFNKLLVSLIIVFIINLAIYIPALFIIKGFSNEYLVIELLISSFASFITAFFFLSLGFLLGTFKNSKKNLYIGLSFLSFSLIFSVIIDLFEKIKFLYFLTPFKYFDAKEFLISGEISLFNSILMIFISFIILIYSFFNFEKKDL